MNGSTIKTMFENIIEHVPDETFTYQLMAMADGRIQRLRDWEILKKFDSSKTSSSGDTYLSMKDLPSDWRKTLKLYLGTTLRFGYRQIPFEQRIAFRDVPYCFYIDTKNSQYAITGTQGSSQTINHFYIYKPTTMAAGVTPVWPEEFHPVLAFEMAEILQGNVDGADEISFKMSAKQRQQRLILLNGLIEWDDDLKLAAMGDRGGYADEVPPAIDIGLL